jgi:hypothetical protein
MSEPCAFKSRGVALIPQDLTLADWPERASRAGLDVLALHPTPGEVTQFVQTAAGQEFLSRCAALGLAVEYELHAMGELLPRTLYGPSPNLFRMDESGARQGDWNLCVSSSEALDVVAQNAVRLAETLRPTTHRYHLWGDDGRPWCRCPQCRPYTDCEQALILENYLVAALRTVDEGAEVAHLAYLNTLEPPRQVQPAAGVYLEFAPIARRYDLPLRAREARFTTTSPTHGEQLDTLDANLAVFGQQGSEVLEYWLDASRFSGWRRPAVQVPWSPEVLAADLETYAARGLQHVTSFAVWLDADYVARYGDPPLASYGACLATCGWPSSTRERKSGG